jgi:hypothetical protein
MQNQIIEENDASRGNDIIIGDGINHDRTTYPNIQSGPYNPISIGHTLRSSGSSINIGNFNDITTSNGFVTCVGQNWDASKYSQQNSVLLGDATSSSNINVVFGGTIPPATNSNNVPVQLALVPGSEYSAFTLVQSFSSIRYKENVKPKNFEIDDFMKLESVQYTNKNGDGSIEFGMIAESVSEIYPEYVVFNEKNECQTIKYDRMVSMLVNVMQQQQQTIQTMKDENQKIKAILIKHDLV